MSLNAGPGSNNPDRHLSQASIRCGATDQEYLADQALRTPPPPQ
jgi:hypothetical protein